MSTELVLPFVLSLADPLATLEQVGGKGASLARLASAGLPVPPGFHLTTVAYRRFVQENGLQAPILAALSAATPDDPASLETASAQIAALFRQATIPETIEEAIRRAYANLGGDDLPVAVRSSATAEDLPDLSFAGQQDTYLNIRGAARVLEAVKRCWASLWTARAIGYRARHAIAPEEVSLAVVVQELVPAQAAGILFTANPLSGARNQALINAAWGLGEAIVGGQVTPDTLVVGKESGKITEETISEKDVMTVRTPEGTQEQAVPIELRRKAVLTPAQATELVRLGVQIEQLYGLPMDIEWALDTDHIFIVQARPITALPEPAAPQERQADAWQLPKPNGRYMRASVIELLPDPLSPLFTGLGVPAWNKAYIRFTQDAGMGDFFDMFVTTINGYAYYDVSYSLGQSLHLVLLMPRIMLRELPRFLRTARQRWEQARSTYSAVVKRWGAIDLHTTDATDLLVGAREIVDTAASYYLTIQSGILPAAYMSELAFTLLYDKLCKRKGDPPAMTFMLGFDSAPLQAEQSLYDLAQWVREQPELADALTKMSSEQFTAAYHEQAVSKSATDGAWPAFWQRLHAHLDRFGHTIYDLDFAKPLLDENPGALLETLKFFLSGQAPDPSTRRASAETAREQATQMMLTRLRGFRLKQFRRRLEVAQRFAPLREDALADTGLGWPLLRRMLHELGQRLVSSEAIEIADDVFWLTEEELQKATIALHKGEAPVKYQEAIAERRATWERQRAQTPPVALPLKGGARFLGIDFTNLMPARSDQPEGNLLKGIAASPGRVTGSARVIHGPDEFDQMRHGDILVAKITTPAWTPLFALAAGIVTDVGGPLSHSSIVAREYHIPAVLGTGAATERLQSGQSITVDGDAGTVTLH